MCALLLRVNFLDVQRLHFVIVGDGALAAALGENDSVSHVFHPDGRS
jgi:hypothetical protein